MFHNENPLTYPSHIPCLKDKGDKRPGRFQNPNFQTAQWIEEYYGSTVLANIQNSQCPISSINWEKLRNPARATFKNPNFRDLCVLEKNWKYSLRQRFQSRNFECVNELEKVMT